MKKSIILFGIINILLGVGLAISPFGAWKFPRNLTNIILTIVELLFIGAGIGLLLKKKIGWSLNIIASSLTVSVILSLSAAAIWISQFEIRAVPAGKIPAFILLYGLVGMGIFSLIHTLNSD